MRPGILSLGGRGLGSVTEHCRVVLCSYAPRSPGFSKLFPSSRGASHMTAPDSRTRWWWTALVTFALVGFGIFFFPAFIITPFRYQNPRTLVWAMAARARAPIVSLLCAL